MSVKANRQYHAFLIPEHITDIAKWVQLRT